MRPANLRPKYDGITRAGTYAQDERFEIYSRDGGRCQACFEPVSFSDFEMAHRIANSKANRLKYGAVYINHPLNKAIAHRVCNSVLNIGNNPEACKKLVEKIKEVIYGIL